MQSADVGALVRHWRTTRRKSQLALASDAEVSARHLSYVETGRSQPSRQMVLRLADALDIPLRERNALLVAAGYAPQYVETTLDAPEMAPVRSAIDLILRHQEPYPAFVLDRWWDVRMANQSAARSMRFFLGREPDVANMVRMVMDPGALRPIIANWEECAGDLIRHLHEQLAASPTDERTRRLLGEALAYPGVPARWRTRDIGAPSTPLLTTVFRKDDAELRFFSTFTTFATPHDVALEDLRIECSFPADEASAARCRALFGGS